MRIGRGIYKAQNISRKIFHRLVTMPIQKSALGKCGIDVYIGENCSFVGAENIFIGNNVSIGVNANFLTTRARIILGNQIMFGPHVFIITGNHRIDILGRYMKTVTDQEKLPEYDEDVIIDDDVWIGANVIILKGVHINKGSVVSAGSVVAKDIEPYSIYGGVPAKKIKNRFTEKEIEKHLSLLGENI